MVYQILYIKFFKLFTITFNFPPISLKNLKIFKIVYNNIQFSINKFKKFKNF